ncbi:MAG: HEAT repeat domain-containing protein [Gemmataceae bacterium]
MSTAPTLAAPTRPLAFPRRQAVVLPLLGRSVVLLLPGVVLALGIPCVPEESQAQLGIGAGLIGFMGLLLLPQPRLGSTTTGLAAIALYVLAQVWLWFLRIPYHLLWYTHFAYGILLAAPLLILASVTLVTSGAHDLRRARLLVKQLLHRRSWPTDLSFCPTLPEVMDLRDALRGDASPALALLGDPRPEIRASALAALAYRRGWKPGEDTLVKQVAQQAKEPPVRAAAVRALAFSRDREQVEMLAGFLRDRAAEVRRSVTEVLFWESERRWTWVRFAVHDALGDPALRDEGPLPLAGVAVTRAGTDRFDRVGQREWYASCARAKRWLPITHTP